MTGFNAFDRWRERQPWIPAWLDNADWKTWLLHAVITVALGQLLGWALPFVDGALGMRFMVVVYLVRELVNIAELRRQGLQLKPIDHVMDVLVPLIVVELIARTQ